MIITDISIKDLLIMEPEIITDERGWFMESFNQQMFEEALHARNLSVPIFVQDNHSLSHKGVVRGLHYQIPPYEQGKLVRVIQGRVWDVVVDIRPNSPTFSQWYGIELSANNHRQLWIPAGFAHGFIALEDNSQFLYKTTAYYAKDCERSLRWNDPELAITWPIPKDAEISLTVKDAQAPGFAQYKRNPAY
ncbi:dTDP-4-dehydrorhamnose 3,5-epimerase [Snodgrassella alvi SCGC AB-598-O02]|nr:dTDP-4-dehydrorhamnose 3,5-epimerase [Snodgrassella alvi]KES11579.1 dTDP-4-dehydrorhamnose 3,5-epimerase [Snodgrassella alvi SCGC AB-598-O02]KES11824.1 dTDP-4-dehydrorhamnose 3,5-epimerase [Snodgrassella alvi SCGC AB-598-O02]KES11972.1 dTDP-4-dehydrorhamnose 3,5-epimerase [Snodgrassella alvi SCGC AB-598-O02]